MTRTLLAVLLVLATSASALDDAQKLTLDLYLDWDMVSSPQISPDGAKIAFTRRFPDKINDRFDSEIWLMNADGGAKRFLVKGSNAKWSPDGKRLAYVSGGQIFVRWMDSGSDTQLTRLEKSPSNLAWSPDGERIAFTMIVPAKGKAVTIKLPDKPAGAKWNEPARVIDKLNFRRDAAGWNEEGFTHIFTVSADGGGTARQITTGDFHHGTPRWLPDSKTIVFDGNRREDAEYFHREADIYAVNVATREIRPLTDRRGPDVNPSVSPDGRLIAYSGYDYTLDTYEIDKLWVMNADGSNKRRLAREFDRDPGEIFWSPAGKGFYFTAEDRGTVNIHYVDLAGGAAREVTSGAQLITLTSVSNTGLAAATATSPHQPADVITVALPKGTARRLTAFNDDVLEGRKLGQVEEIWYDSVGGFRVQGWIVKPPDFDPSKKYPLILSIHGGPHNMYGVGFNFEFQNHAANGYVVLYTNPRGSSGYGKAFGNAINNNYPGQDYDDLMKGVDEVIRRGYIDERNLFVVGGSGGGVLTSWIIGHTDRFAAAVVMKPVINWYSFVGTTDFSGWYYNFRKLPWEDPEEHLRRSPITYVANVKTPTMLLTGELDLRTPMEQTEQYYRALKLRRVDTVMVRINDEYHGFNSDMNVRHPSSRMQQILYVRGWFDKYRRP